MYELSAVIAAGVGGGRVPYGVELLEFVDAVLVGDESELMLARQNVLNAVGADAFVDVCATVASFNAVVKIADGTGISLEDAKAERTRELREELGVNALKAG